MKWNTFDNVKGSKQKLPLEKKYVLIRCHNLETNFPDPILVGYLKFAAGVKDSPYFVTPGGNNYGKPYEWNDCLPDNFEWPPTS